MNMSRYLKGLLSIQCIVFGLLINIALAQDVTKFPLKVSDNKRHLVDQNNKPFLINADAGWWAFTKVSVDESVEYMKMRKAQGFNSIQVQLTPQINVKNLNGDLPFLGDNDFTQPNEKFFEHSDLMFKKAEELNMFLIVAPIWIGCCGEDWGGVYPDGRPKPIKANGKDKCRQFGRWLGERYGKFQNVMWIMGGDNNPGNDREEVRQIALGLKETAKHQLVTYHASATLSSTDVWKKTETWIDIVMVYTYYGGKMGTWTPHHPEVYTVCLKEYNRYPGPRPFFLGESQYEGGSGNDDGTAQHARRQAYWSILGGATGHCYGSPVYSFKPNWRDYIDLPGANHLKHFYTLFSTRNWHDLVPDQENSLIASGNGIPGGPLFITAATTTDGKLALVYIPPGSSINRRLIVNLNKLAGPVKARWYDPTSGSYRHVVGSPFTKKTYQEFVTPGKNATGETDFVLVLESNIKN
jgi:hypothetical protein